MYISNLNYKITLPQQKKNQTHPNVDFDTTDNIISEVVIVKSIVQRVFQFAQMSIRFIIS